MPPETPRIATLTAASERCPVALGGNFRSAPFVVGSSAIIERPAGGEVRGGGD